MWIVIFESDFSARIASLLSLSVQSLGNERTTVQSLVATRVKIQLFKQTSNDVVKQKINIIRF